MIFFFFEILGARHANLGWTKYGINNSDGHVWLIPFMLVALGLCLAILLDACSFCYIKHEMLDEW